MAWWIIGCVVCGTLCIHIERCGAPCSWGLLGWSPSSRRWLSCLVVRCHCMHVACAKSHRVGGSFLVRWVVVGRWFGWSSYCGRWLRWHLRLRCCTRCCLLGLGQIGFIAELKICQCSFLHRPWLCFSSGLWLFLLQNRQWLFSHHHSCFGLLHLADSLSTTLVALDPRCCLSRWLWLVLSCPAWWVGLSLLVRVQMGISLWVCEECLVCWV